VDTTETGPRRGHSGYRRSTGSDRGAARRQELLERVTDDLAENGLVDFSLRRAARAAGTTHKVLLYHFEGADPLLIAAVLHLRERRIDHALAAVAQVADQRSLAARVRAVWPVLIAPESGSRVLDQAIGLALYHPQRYGELGKVASQQYMPSLLSLCPEHWSPERKGEVSEMILATLRGFLIERATSGDAAGIETGMTALMRALEREESTNP
jgi:AcrR family transcriptional regulator